MPKLSGKTESYRATLLESLQKPEDAAHYLNACLDDEDACSSGLFAMSPTPMAESAPCRAILN